MDGRCLGGDDQPLDDVAELADVPRPGVVAEDAHRRAGDALDLAVVPQRGLFDEVLDELRDVVAPLAERGHAEADDAEPIIQVGPHPAVGEQLVDVAVGGGHDADIQRDEPLAAEPAHLPLLEHAEQVDLGLGRHLGDLVEEQGAPGAISNQPGFWRSAPLKAPFS